MRYKGGAKPKPDGPYTSKHRRKAIHEHPASAHSVEPETPRQTGSSKPAQRGILNDNAQTGQTQEHPEK